MILSQFTSPREIETRNRMIFFFFFWPVEPINLGLELTKWGIGRVFVDWRGERNEEKRTRWERKKFCIVEKFKSDDTLVCIPLFKYYPRILAKFLTFSWLFMQENIFNKILSVFNYFGKEIKRLNYHKFVDLCLFNL